jgi:hypothetical protein
MDSIKIADYAIVYYQIEKDEKLHLLSAIVASSSYK